MLLCDSPVCLCTVILCPLKKLGQHPTSVKFSLETLEWLFNWRKLVLSLTQRSISFWLSILFQAVLTSFPAKHTQIDSGHGWRSTRTVAANEKLTFPYRGTIVGQTILSIKTFGGRSKTGHGTTEKWSETFLKTVSQSSEMFKRSFENARETLQKSVWKHFKKRYGSAHIHVHVQYCIHYIKSKSIFHNETIWALFK